MVSVVEHAALAATPFVGSPDFGSGNSFTLPLPDDGVDRATAGPGAGAGAGVGTGRSCCFCCCACCACCASEDDEPFRDPVVTVINPCVVIAAGKATFESDASFINAPRSNDSLAAVAAAACGTRTEGAVFERECLFSGLVELMLGGIGNDDFPGGEGNRDNAGILVSCPWWETGVVALCPVWMGGGVFGVALIFLVAAAAPTALWILSSRSDTCWSRRA